MLAGRSLVALTAAMLIGGAGARAQSPTRPEPAAMPSVTPQVAKALLPTLPLTGEAGIVFFTIRADSALDFEAFLTKVKDALGASPSADHQQMAAGWKVYKAVEASDPTQSLYALVLNPVVKGADYDPIKILAALVPSEAPALRAKMEAVIVSVNKLNLQSMK